MIAPSRESMWREVLTQLKPLRDAGGAGGGSELLLQQYPPLRRGMRLEVWKLRPDPQAVACVAVTSSKPS